MSLAKGKHGEEVCSILFTTYDQKASPNCKHPIFLLHLGPPLALSTRFDLHELIHLWELLVMRPKGGATL